VLLLIVFKVLYLVPFVSVCQRWAVCPKLQGWIVLFGKAKVMEDTFSICLNFYVCHIKGKLFVTVVNTTSFVWNFICSNG